MNNEINIRAGCRYPCFAPVILFLLILAWGVPARAGNASLEDMVVSKTRNFCLVSFRVTGCFTEEMIKAIDNGIPATFTFFVGLYRIRPFWRDKEIANLEVRHSIRYDNLRKTYRVRLSEKENQVFYTKDFKKARKLMSEINGLEVAELRDLKKGSRYQVRMMAKLDKVKLPFYLHYVLFFVSLWDFDTDWYAVNFSY